MKKLLIVFLLSTILSACSTLQKNVDRPKVSPLENHVDSLIKPLIDNAKLKGCVIGIAHKGKVIFIKSYGYSDLSNQTSLKVDAVFPIASVTKTFTAVAIMQLVAKKRIDLDESVSKYIDFNSHGNTITVRQLLNHTSGLKDYTETDILKTIGKANFSTIALKNQLEKLPFDFLPGEQMDYTNSGYFLLALMIEKISGLSYQAYLKEFIFQPLEMVNSANCYSITSDKVTEGFNLSKSNLYDATGPIDYRMAIGAGSICSSVKDLLQWQIAFHYQKKILSHKMYDQMINRTRIAVGGATNYGLGLEIDQYSGNLFISHNGVIEGHLSDTKYFPSKDLSIVVLSNTLGPVKPSGLSNLISSYFIPPKDITMPFTGNIKDFAGLYKGNVMGNEISLLISEKNENMTIESRGVESILKYTGNNTWIAEDGYTYYFKNSILQVNSPKLSIIFSKKV